MSKTPYEIRADILHLAKSLLDEQYSLQRDLAHRALDACIEAGKMTDPSQWKQHFPEMYSVEDLVKKSQELYGFVTKKD